MILECDIGNTRSKWRLLEGGKIVGRGVLVDAGPGFSGIPTSPAIKRVRVACVAGKERELSFQSWVSEKLGLSCEFARSKAETAGMVNSYTQPEKMGVDRWLAALAAYHHYHSAVLVIDLGSALNAELIDGEGRHLGGYIIPGAGLMKAALLTGTGQVDVDDELLASMEPGRSTSEAVYFGITVSLIGTIKQIIEQARLVLPADFNIVITGGGVEFVRPYLPEQIDWQPDLVMDGLQWLLP